MLLHFSDGAAAHSSLCAAAVVALPWPNHLSAVADRGRGRTSTTLDGQMRRSRMEDGWSRRTINSSLGKRPSLGLSLFRFSLLFLSLSFHLLYVRARRQCGAPSRSEKEMTELANYCMTE